jgi:hypothetical protein
MTYLNLLARKVISLNRKTHLPLLLETEEKITLTITYHPLQSITLSILGRQHQNFHLIMNRGLQLKECQRLSGNLNPLILDPIHTLI